MASKKPRPYKGSVFEGMTPAQVIKAATGVQGVPVAAPSVWPTSLAPKPKPPPK